MNETKENIFKKTITITGTVKEREMHFFDAFHHEKNQHICCGSYSSYWGMIIGYTYEVIVQKDEFFSFEILSARRVKTKILPASAANTLREMNFEHNVSFANSQIIAAAKSFSHETAVLTCNNSDYYNDKLCSMLIDNGYTIKPKSPSDSSSLGISWEPASVNKKKATA